jgi:hypothetical protein
MAPTLDGQAELRGLLLGRDTSYRLVGFNPWSRTIRHQRQEHAWQHGGWSGREFTGIGTVTLRVLVDAVDAASWLTAHQALAAAFAPSDEDLELRFRQGGAEYLVLGRPHPVDPTPDAIGIGKVFTSCVFAALDPRIYSGDLQVVTLGLPSSTGGLVVPFTAPFTIDAVTTSGRATILNAGTVDTGLVLRIDGPVQEPIVRLFTGTATYELAFDLTLTLGQWLDVDTERRTVYLNGTSSRRGLTSGEFPILPPGVGAELGFDAAVYDAGALLTASWRHAWQ